MRKLMLLVVVAVAVSGLSGCQTCRRIGGWFHRGDRCEPPAMGCPPGVPRATYMVPGSPAVLPQPIEMTPIN